jgi:hypothetical protein
MSTVLTNNLVLSLDTLRENAGRLCYRNIVTTSNITATSALPSAPITNAANPATAFGWEASSTAAQTITIANDTGMVDYIGIARHNLNQPGLEIRIRFNGTTVLPYQSVPNRQALLYLFNEAIPSTIQIDFRNATIRPKLAVIYIGQSTKLERDIYVGHTPITMGRDRNVITGVSQSGEYLGEVRLNETLSTGVSLQNLTPDWYRSELDPFFGRSPRDPCFWAWRPSKYPAEVSYCWVEGNPRPTNQRSNGMMQIDWNFRGIK